MTKKEAIRINQQESTLIQLGFTPAEAEQLRRISLTLHRWHELECGTDHVCLVRGRWNQDTVTFDYDDNGRPYFEYAGNHGRSRYAPVADRERGAMKRLDAIIKARNERAIVVMSQPGDIDATTPQLVRPYVQGDPRGAALYIIRPGDVPEGKDVNGYYSRGICVY